MKKILLIMICIFMTLLISACGKDNSNVIDLKVGTYTTVCTIINDGEEVYSKTIATTNYDENKYAINMKIENIEKFTDKEEYNSRVKDIEKNAEDYDGISDMIYTYTTDDKNQEVTTEIKYLLLEYTDLTENDKNNYLIKNTIKDSEQNGATCVITGITREELGL